MNEKDVSYKGFKLKFIEKPKLFSPIRTEHYEVHSPKGVVIGFYPNIIQAKNAVDEWIKEHK